MSWPTGRLSSSEELLSPTDALELLRAALMSSEAPWAPQLVEFAGWNAAQNPSSFQDVVGWLGLDVLVKQRHARLCSILSRQEDEQTVVAPKANAVVSTLPVDAIHPRTTVHRKRPRSSSAAESDDGVENRALQLRPRILRLGTRSGSILVWLGTLQRGHDLEMVLEFLGLASSANLLRCLFAVGAMALWQIYPRPAALSADALLRQLVGESSPAAWTATLLQLMHGPSEDTSSHAHMEGIAQLLFPSEATATLINVYVAPMLQSQLQAEGTRQSSRVLREPLAECCALLAPFLSRGAFGGLDVPRGAKYYPAARELQIRWTHAFVLLFKRSQAKSEEPQPSSEDDEDEDDHSS